MKIRVKKISIFLVFLMGMFAVSTFGHEVSWPGKRLSKLLPEASNFKQKQTTLTSAQITELENIHKVKIGPEDRSPIFYFSYGAVDQSTGRPSILGIIVFVDVIGEYGPIELSVVLNSRGEVIKADVWEQSDTRRIQNKDFLGQFSGKTSADAFTIGEDIQAAKGAQMSSQAVATGVKKGILLMHTVFKKKR